MRVQSIKLPGGWVAGRGVDTSREDHVSMTFNVAAAVVLFSCFRLSSQGGIRIPKAEHARCRCDIGLTPAATPKRPVSDAGAFVLYFKGTVDSTAGEWASLLTASRWCA